MIARIIKAEICVISCYLPKLNAEADNTNRGVDNFTIIRKPNPIKCVMIHFKTLKPGFHWRRKDKRKHSYGPF